MRNFSTIRNCTGCAVEVDIDNDVLMMLPMEPLHTIYHKLAAMGLHDKGEILLKANSHMCSIRCVKCWVYDFIKFTISKKIPTSAATILLDKHIGEVLSHMDAEDYIKWMGNPVLN